VLLRRGACETKIKRVFTSYDRTDCRSCQYIKWVLVFRDWAQNSMSINGDKGPHTAEGTGLACDAPSALGIEENPKAKP
jgi:hypothetical protein